ncbi:alpha-L-fucosidase [Pedobacter hiemivivus]|uniref:alpha-L-fucosidase n=1 Tax=Pedobacter hiemivivus TaxID=2530454 RepID=A0A4R0M9V0_9SPHI|nr:alpha-L-fucosidase [Pedobacter hiemivivus]TCC82909.1 alpha-L-fucosidase [Pedobacter hiemivivus]
MNRSPFLSIGTFILIFTLFNTSFNAFGQSAKYEANWASLDNRPLPGWFEDAKFGIFIHWGPYSVPAWAPKGMYSEWYQYWLNNNDKRVNEHHDQVYGKDYSYYNFGDLFKAEDYKPDDWAKLMEAAGAKYVVLTSKHHDGFSLWPNKEASKAYSRPWNSVETGPKQDLVAALADAVRKTDMKMGFYYSLFEWYNPLWQSDKKRFVDEHLFPQVKDLVTKYKPDILWADGEWEMSDKDWKSEELLAWLYNESPVKDKIMVNDRWGKDTRKKHGGYYTTEYAADFQANKPWEECRGMGFSFGFNKNEDLQDYNSAQTLILMLVNIVSSGGNLLLDIGPDANGKIPPIMQERLLQIGAWMKVNGEAIYGTRKWKNTFQWSAGKTDWQPKKEGSEGGSYILKQTVDPDPGYAVKEAFFTSKGNNLYAILPKLPVGKFLLKGVNAQGNAKVKLLGSNKTIKWRKVAAGLELDLPAFYLNELAEQPAYTVHISNINKN